MYRLLLDYMQIDIHGYGITNNEAEFYLIKARRCC